MFYYLTGFNAVTILRTMTLSIADAKLKAPNFYLFDTQLSKQFNNNAHSKFIIYEKR